MIAHPNRFGWREPVIARPLAKEVQGALDVASVVKRQRGLVLGEALAIRILGILLLAVG